jgi:hypothetical protein
MKKDEVSHPDYTLETLHRIAAYGEEESARVGNKFLAYLFAMARLQAQTELTENRGGSRNRKTESR